MTGHLIFSPEHRIYYPTYPLLQGTKQTKIRIQQYSKGLQWSDWPGVVVVAVIVIGCAKLVMGKQSDRKPLCCVNNDNQQQTKVLFHFLGLTTQNSRRCSCGTFLSTFRVSASVLPRPVIFQSQHTSNFSLDLSVRYWLLCQKVSGAITLFLPRRLADVGPGSRIQTD